AARGRPRGEVARRAARTQTHSRRDRQLEAARGVQLARAVSRRSGLRSERRELSRTVARSLYRLQPARTRARAGEGSIEEASALSPHPAAGLRGFSEAAQDQASQAARAAADRQESERG